MPVPPAPPLAILLNRELSVKLAVPSTVDVPSTSRAPPKTGPPLPVPPIAVPAPPAPPTTALPVKFELFTARVVVPTLSRMAMAPPRPIEADPPAIDGENGAVAASATGAAVARGDAVVAERAKVQSDRVRSRIATGQGNDV